MSFILDALRKSDAERQRSATPGLADARYAGRRSARSWWMPVLVITLVANMLFMGVEWFRRAAETAPVPVPAAGPVAAAPEPPAAAPPPMIRPLAREASEAGSFLEPPPDPDFPAELPLADTPPPQPVVRAEPQPAPPRPIEAQAPAQAAAPSSRIIQGDDLPTMDKLVSAGLLNMPSLNLDLHVYSDQPASRFVVINSRRYNEGGELAEGPRVEAITAEGVILASGSQRFTLARK